MNNILPIDFYLLTCITRFFTNPYEIIRSSFIRPEDLIHFENIDMDKFKPGERGINKDNLSRIVTAYTNRSYDGNLIDLVPTMSKYKIVSEPSLWHMIKYYENPA